MNEEDRPVIVQTVEELQRRWRGLLERAPPHLMKLEFRLDEAVFHHCIKDIEKELVYEEQVRVPYFFNLNECVWALHIS